ncbi:tetratricopeptide repeat protein [uncultured Hoeflea sp.]|uniref:tetratricopeptide repeat protein n=1 Tax=uncultured Hoeflea sp. TaxID=538666 RepID=UPI002621B2DD|nr:tetratricopeptide repeat protein [uncultured Hoeflea sp.]
MKHDLRMITLSLATAVGVSMSPAAFAAGDGGSGASDTTSQCRNGKVWDKRQGKCVDPQKGAIDDDSLYEAGRDLAYAGRYDQAIDVLTLASNRNDKRILNFLGFAHRKAGRLEVGIGYYLQALEIDPEYALVREYYGEALLMKGDLEGARAQLSAIESLCGSQACEEYQDLAEDIEAFEKTRDG